MTGPRITPDTVVRRAPGVVWETAEDELVLLDPESRLCHAANPTGRRIWALIETPRRVAEIRQAIAGRAGPDEPVDDFLGRVAELGLVELGRE